MPAFPDNAETRKLKQAIDWHLGNIAVDAELKQRLEGMATQPLFGSLAWYWAPRLYSRNRAMFRAFILQHLRDTFEVQGGPFVQWHAIDWKGPVAQALDPWFAAVDAADDVVLFRRLFQWRHRPARGWGLDADAWNQALVARVAAAGTPAARALALEKLDLRETLEEATALRLYDADPAAATPFILKHLPHRPWRDKADTRWLQLMQRADARGDAALKHTLYRRQIPLDRWHDEVLALARSIQPAAQLLAALHERHPEGHWSDLGATFLALLEARGTDVLPYVQQHLSDVHARFLGPDSAKALARLARQRGWVDFWIAILVKVTSGKPYNEGLAATLDDQGIAEDERLRRLALFSGLSREWNHLGWGLAQVQQLEPELALKLYERHPQLVRTLFKAHVTPAWGPNYLSLFERAEAQGDEDLADHLASRYLTRGMWGRPRGKDVEPAERVADMLVALKLSPGAFARRAASILTRVPAYAIPDYDNLLRNNRLARLLFERSFDHFLDEPDGASLRDLVEGSEIHVQRLAYRVLGRPDPRARRLARDNLDLLLGTLLRKLHRETRMHALVALRNAAHDDESAARRVLARAREAFALPDDGYPKEALLSLVGHVLARHPQLAAPGELRVVYRQAA